MKKIAVIGAGYAGLAVATGLAHFGNKIRCFDIDEKKIALLSEGDLPFYEPEMEEELHQQVAEGRLSFETNVVEGVTWADIVFIAVGTPGMEKGAADVSAVLEVAETIGRHSGTDTVVVIKSTVPLGTCEKVQDVLRKTAQGRWSCDVVANPEFLREGQALRDFFHPARIVIGAESERAVETMRALYAPLVKAGVPFLITDFRTAEMIKYSANSFLAMKVAFINEIARLCDAMGADVTAVVKALGADPRIGNQYLSPGPGYGGSCLPKDTEAFALSAREAEAPLTIVEAVIESNKRHKLYVAEKVKQEFSDLRGIRLAVFGLAFKAGTDDMRESPAVAIIEQLLKEGAQVSVYDPEALINAKKRWRKQLAYGKNPYETAKGACAVLVLTEWPEFLALDAEKLGRVMKKKVLFDFRNLYNRSVWERAGFQYRGMGR
ncbi:UDP-glucose dehydrogenase family protein [Aneurinibacillus thermoaerophilus]|uniref:UDP-glucose 6-dehydrogenase n=1 Tax=Aneurinibacillus thermoaerophilus TaxID=143495 RepID=A0ABX8Y835_ANETH|nr:MULTISPECIES: UDP-glucose/GDP-mannose dehydrogenase family protein [Aneurinibacillus]AMA72449.1 hypothetical protein ACH33_06015 [Aneurinibacillus sp. XH2]QYY41802.1 UDP-glucose/GDP-mannose dehydrogenase family protein [Aneurinibacillus thermoaerophilus]